MRASKKPHTALTRLYVSGGKEVADADEKTDGEVHLPRANCQQGYSFTSKVLPLIAVVSLNARL